jgi:primosomal replication protein N
VNRVFLSGRLQEKAEVRYTPKGEKIVMFPLKVDDGAFTVEVVYLDAVGSRKIEREAGAEVLVAGAIARNPGRTREGLRVRASKIFWMED